MELFCPMEIINLKDHANKEVLLLALSSTLSCRRIKDTFVILSLLLCIDKIQITGIICNHVHPHCCVSSLYLIAVSPHYIYYGRVRADNVAKTGGLTHIEDILSMYYSCTSPEGPLFLGYS